MRTLVIGGTGFIGRFLVPRLVESGHEVAVVMRPESEARLPEGARAVRADRRRLPESARELRALAPDVVIDLILSSGRQADDLMSVFRGHAGRLVAISSVDVYRATEVLHRLVDGPLEPVPLTEESALRTMLQTYPAAQIAMLKQLFGWLDDEYDKIPAERSVSGHADLPSTILRLPMIHGPGDRLHRFHGLIKRMQDGRRTIVLAESVARWRGPRGYVENVAEACLLAAASPRAVGRTYNVSEAESLTELEWARLIAHAMRWEGEFVVVPDDDAPESVRMPGDLRQHWAADSTRIRTELGYTEPVPRDEAVRRTVAWERANPPAAPMSAFDYDVEDAAALRASSRRSAPGSTQR
jgi:nucleoside-diphosphate-sugar epimerase